MLPRILRVSRCKAPHKTLRAIDKKTAERSAALKASGFKAKKTGYVPKLTPEQQTMAGRAGKLLGHSAKARMSGKKTGPGPGPKRRERTEKRLARFGPNKDEDSKDGPPAGLRTPESIIFEGRRASARDAKPKDLKMKMKKSKKNFGGGKPKKSSK